MASTVRETKKFYEIDERRLKGILDENKPIVSKLRKQGRLAY